MTHFRDNLLKYTAIYRCCDDITNLKIRIKLKECGYVTDDVWEQKVLGWQEKAFSRAERDLYKDENNCVTDLEKKYHSEVTKSQPDAKLNIFTYVNDDDYTEQGNEEDNKEQEFDYKKFLLAALENPTKSSYKFDAMFIMADLGEYVENTWITRETMLCTVKYDKKYRILSIYPDFAQDNCYQVKVNGNTPRIFKYCVENGSETGTEELLLKEQTLINKVNNHKLASRRQLNFVLPPNNQRYISLHFEILWAKQFEYDTIYVQYVIDLPSGWSCTDALDGMTNTCCAKGAEGLAHFGHVFDITLTHEESLISLCPYIYFEVISRDSWGRYRTEGLTYKALPVNTPGTHQLQLQCLRLLPNSVFGQLRRFFIGDCSNYNDITWIGVPRNHESPVLNKYGTETVGTGQIGVRVSVIRQSQPSDAQNGDVFQKRHTSTLVKSVEQVLLAFKKARKNMLVARKNV